MLNSWSGSNLIYAAQAVYSGLADYCLVIQVETRSPHMSAQASSDPFRMNPTRFGESSYGVYSAEWIHTGQVYAAWLNRYMDDYKAPRQTFGLVAINNRQWASRNPAAVKREPITMDDYLNARPIWEPFGVLDMDLPVDGAEATRPDDRGQSPGHAEHPGLPSLPQPWRNPRRRVLRKQYRLGQDLSVGVQQGSVVPDGPDDRGSRPLLSI